MDESLVAHQTSNLSHSSNIRDLPPKNGWTNCRQIERGETWIRGIPTHPFSKQVHQGKLDCLRNIGFETCFP